MSTPASEAELLREYLASRDVPCVRCGYNLRGLTSGRCPECDLPVTLVIGSREPPWATWLAALAGVWVLPSGALLVLMFVSWLRFASNERFSRQEYLEVFIVPGVILVAWAGAGVWLAGRRGRAWFFGLKKPARAMAIGWIWLISMVVYVAWCRWVTS